jgi:TPR repeat protein
MKFPFWSRPCGPRLILVYLFLLVLLSAAELTHPAQLPSAANDDLGALDFTVLLLRADAGDPRVLAELGSRHFIGRDGAEKDYAQAAKYFRKAAAQAYPLAEIQLGFLYQRGLGVPQDYEEARRWYRRAVAQGDLDANRLIAALNHRQLAELAKLDLLSLQKLAEAGDPVAQDALGGRYRQGVGGVVRDYAQAMAWFLKAAQQGNPIAQSNVGSMYHDGQGVPRDYATALSFFRKAADQGSPSAQSNIGFMYQNGQGVPRDYAEAFLWYTRAAEQGNLGAQLNLGVMYQQGQGIPKDFEQARAWYQKAANQGLEAARNALIALAKEQQATIAAHPTPPGDSLPDIVAGLEAAKSSKLKLSKQEQSRFRNASDLTFFTAGCNKNDFHQAEGDWNTSRACARLAAILAPQDSHSELAHLRACAFVDDGSAAGNHCATLGEYYAQHNNIDRALAVYQRAPNCFQRFDNDASRSACFQGAATLLRNAGLLAQEREPVLALCSLFDDLNACERANELALLPQGVMQHAQPATVTASKSFIKKLPGGDPPN